MGITHIVARIITHLEVYQNAGLPVPSYRLTCYEHKQLVNYCKGLSKQEPRGMCASFYGVDLEVVTRVEEYL